mmetsp:Transcript_67005/g.139658  ORF Transcript_67005/g.139658 Transcript_67005/m.139658 type:complete len:265 (-) Transcript_67005:37-831(-)
MKKRIIIWNFFSDNFLTISIGDILILRSSFRIQGILVRKSFFDLENLIFLLLNTQEVLLGIETGFFTFKSLPFFESSKLKNLFFRFFFPTKNKEKLCTKSLISGSPRYCSKFLIRKWRETKSLLLNVTKRKNFFPVLVFKKKKRFLRGINPSTPRCLSLKVSIKSIRLSDFLSYIIYRDLWGRGFTVSCGLKFGASFLVYANSLELVHSFLSILVIPFSVFSNSHNLISFGRVGTITKKSTLLISLSEKGFIKYIGLKWNKNLP